MISFEFINGLRRLYLAKYSSVILLETTDINRIRLLEKIMMHPDVNPFSIMVGDGVKAYPRTQIYVNLLPPLEHRTIDIKIGNMTITESPRLSAQTPGALLTAIYNLMKQQPTIVVLDGIHMQETARQIEPLLIKIATSPGMYKDSSRTRKSPAIYPPKVLADIPSMMSAVIVIVPSTSLFSSTAREYFGEVIVKHSTFEERLSLIKKSLEKTGYIIRDKCINTTGKCIETEKVHLFATITNGLTLQETERITALSLLVHDTLSTKVVSQYKREILAKYGIEYYEPKYGFNVVGGYQRVKDWLTLNFISILRNTKEAEKYGVRIPRGLLFFGVPGTGKTLLAKTLAYEIGLPLAKLDASQILSGIVGESEKRARQLTKIFDEYSPIVVLIDEAEQLFMKREYLGMGDSGVSLRVQNILLSWMGEPDREAIIIMTTNLPERFDFASIRAGRIDAGIPIMYPDREARREIFRIHLEVIRRPKIPVEVDYDVLASQSTLMTGAEIETVCDMAKKLAFTKSESKITTEIVLKAIGMVKESINLEERKNNAVRMIENAKKVETILIPKELIEYAEKGLEEEKEEVEISEGLRF